MDIKRWFKKNRSSILSIVACVGVAATGVLTYFGTIKAQETIKEWTKEKRDELTPFEKVQASAKPLLPAVGAAIGTMVCIGSAQKINKADLAIATSGAVAAAKKYDDYRKANIEVNGIEAHEKVKERLAVQKAEKVNFSGPCLLTNRTLGTQWDDSKPSMFYDEVTEQYIEKPLVEVLDALYHLNRDFTLGKDISVQDYCAYMGIKNKKNDERGWSLNDGFTWLDFDIHKPVDVGDGLMVSVIEPMWTPRKDYYLDDDIDYDEILNDSKVPF